jgi:hypothetical protein
MWNNARLAIFVQAAPLVARRKSHGSNREKGAPCKHRGEMRLRSFKPRFSEPLATPLIAPGDKTLEGDG